MKHHFILLIGYLVGHPISNIIHTAIRLQRFLDYVQHKSYTVKMSLPCSFLGVIKIWVLLSTSFVIILQFTLP